MLLMVVVEAAEVERGLNIALENHVLRRELGTKVEAAGVERELNIALENHVLRRELGAKVEGASEKRLEDRYLAWRFAICTLG
jgi:hypothetical protein